MLLHISEQVAYVNKPINLFIQAFLPDCFGQYDSQLAVQCGVNLVSASVIVVTF